MVNVPIELVEAEARKDGLKHPLNITFKPTVVNWYHSGTHTLTIRSYNNQRRLAQILAHEIKHQIDLQDYPGWLVGLAYWPVIVVIGLLFGFTYGILVGIGAGLATYFFHPFEISANLYTLRKWRRYLEIIESSE